MDIKIIKVKNLPAQAKAILVYPYIFTLESATEIDINHEMIHVMQIKREGFIKCRIKYMAEYLINLIKYRDTQKAYRNISYEIEAYENQHDLSYTKNK